MDTNGISSKITIAAEVITLTGFTGIGDTDWIPLADNSAVQRGNILEDLRFAVRVEVLVNFHMARD